MFRTYVVAVLAALISHEFAHGFPDLLPCSETVADNETFEMTPAPPIQPMEDEDLPINFLKNGEPVECDSTFTEEDTIEIEHNFNTQGYLIDVTGAEFDVSVRSAVKCAQNTRLFNDSNF